MFLRMEKAYKKHLIRMQKPHSKEPKSEVVKSNPPTKKTKEIHRDFTSFGSKNRTTPSSSKRSSNDTVGKPYGGTNLDSDKVIPTGGDYHTEYFQTKKRGDKSPKPNVPGKKTPNRRQKSKSTYLTPSNPQKSPLVGSKTGMELEKRVERVRQKGILTG